MQCRTGSSRLPGKVLLPLAGKPLFVRQAERIMAAKMEFDFIVATTTLKEDDVIKDICRENSITCFSGHPTDLLDRHVQAAKYLDADTVVKIPSDCPLIDPGIIDRVIAFFKNTTRKYDYFSNLHPATYPDGNDVEVMSMKALEKAWNEAILPFEREHTTPFLWENKDRFNTGNVAWETGLDYSMTYRFTIDYPEDYEFIKTVYDELYTQENPIFSLSDILDLLDRRPDIFQINSKYAGVNWYRHHIGELKTITEAETKVI